MNKNQNSPYFPQIGEVLRNGHTVDAAYCVGGDRYVLAHKDGAPEPYVVWEVDQDGDTYGGRYFTDQMRAQRYFANCCYDWSEKENKTAQQALLAQSMDIVARSVREDYKRSSAINDAVVTLYTAILKADQTSIPKKRRLELLESLLYSQDIKDGRIGASHMYAIERVKYKFSAGII